MRILGHATAACIGKAPGVRLAAKDCQKQCSLQQLRYGIEEHRLTKAVTMAQRDQHADCVEADSLGGESPPGFSILEPSAQASANLMGTYSSCRRRFHSISAMASSYALTSCWLSESQMLL